MGDKLDKVASHLQNHMTSRWSRDKLIKPYFYFHKTFVH